ncbi:glycosyltransferase family 4 protein [Pontiellaceae bacterium B1224]|nr:glycosyltransferase family 4 protein [Pontiellaceae bacterium B1224]
MRVLHICQRDDPDTGGSLRVAEALVREQRQSGVDAWLLFLYGPPAKVAKAFSRNTACLGLESSAEAYRGIPRLKKEILRLAPDVIHSHDGILWPRLLFLMMRTPVITHSHLPMTNVMGLKESVGKKLVLLTTYKLIGISLHTIESWVDNGYRPSKIHYIPNGVDFERFCSLPKDEKNKLRDRLGIPRDKRMMLWVGRIHREMKGSDRVERIASLLPDDLVLVVVGNGPDYVAMKENCVDPITDGKLILVGSTNTPEQYYRAADEFLFTSYHEPFGLVILEAVASGLPILAFSVSRGGGAEKLLEEVGACIIKDESNERIQHLLTYDALRYDVAGKNRERAREKYTWAAVSDKVVDVYKIALMQKHWGKR